MRQYILTERAHFMCPNMHFGIKAKICAKYDGEKMQDTLKKLASAHPFLQNCVAKEPESGRLYYCWNEELQIRIFEKDNCLLWENDYNDIGQGGWDVFQECLLKLVVYPVKDYFEVMFISHHLLGDGRSILGLVCEFADYYISGQKPVFAEENLITSINELPNGSQLSGISKLVIGYANHKWRKERHTVQYEQYKRFEKEFIANHPVSYIEEEWDEMKTKEVLKKCHEQNVSLNDYFVAAMMCKEKIDRVVVAVDIRKHLSQYQLGALGNYASATAIAISDRPEDIWAVAKLVSEQIKKSINDPRVLMMILACYLNMEPELIDAAAVSTIGGFKSKAARFVGALMLGYKNRNGYSVTNLGNVDNPNIVEAMFIPPASPANIKTMGILAVNHRLKLCTAFNGTLL